MPNPTHLLAFGFGNLAMLGWLAAAAAPLLIHLWSRHRFREVDWAAVQFLLSAMRKNARRLKLQQWLLLAVRTLLIVLVVLAAAEPYGAGLIAGGSTAAPTHKILVLDTSYSMTHYLDADNSDSRGQGKESTSDTNFGRAKSLAAELVRNSSAADTFTLIAMSQPARTVLGCNVVDSAAIAEQIASLAPSHTAANLAATLDLVAEALNCDANSSRRLERQEVYFFTDLQRSTWSANEREPTAGHAHELLKAMASKATVVIVDVGTPDASNLAVTRLAAHEPLAAVGQELAFSATLHNFGDQPRQKCVVEILVDGQPFGEQTVDVPAGGDADVHFTHRFDMPGSHTIALRAAADALRIDDTRYLAFPVKDRVAVLCVAGRDGAAKYVASALRPDSSAASVIEPTIITEGELQDVELTDFDCIFLCNVAQLTASEAERLARFAASGGGVIFFLGDRVDAEKYNELARRDQGSLSTEATGKLTNPPVEQGSPSSRAAPLFPVQLGPITDSTSFGIDPLDYNHPIVAPFRGRERAGLLTTPVARYFKLLAPQDRPDIEIAAALPNGDPLIVAAPVGTGCTIVVATDGSLSSVDATTGNPWTTWPTWPSFLPVIRELTLYASAGRHGRAQQTVGEVVSGILHAATTNTELLEILRPDGRVDSVDMRISADGLHWSYDKTDISGIYTLRGKAATEAEQFAVNVDTVESNLAKTDVESLPTELLVRDTWQKSSGAAAAGLLTRSAWNLPLLWTALGLVFLESLLAWQFGRGAE